MQEIVTLVKEKEMVEECKYQLENSISTITESICHAKSIKKDYLLETLIKRNVSSTSEDAILLPLITAIEFSSVQYIETTSISTVTRKPDEKEIAEIEDSGSRKSSVEEGKTLKVQSQQGY